MKYKLVVCGGTFDHLHAGHISFLRGILSMSEKVIIGLTSDMYVHTLKKDTGEIAPYADRLTNLENFFRKEHAFDRVHIIPIDNMCGPAVDPTFPIEAIVVTPQTIKGADIVNKERKKKCLLVLPIVVVPLLKADTGTVLSSTLIRKGEVDTEGRIFILSNTLRPLFRKPLGPVITGEIIEKIDENKLVTVGDVTTKRFVASGMHPKIAVIDFVVERQSVDKAYNAQLLAGNAKKYYIDNPAASITSSSWNTLQTIINKLSQNDNTVLIVN